MRCAGGLKDGTSVSAKILQLFDSEKHPSDKTWALLEIDIKTAFNKALRQAASLRSMSLQAQHPECMMMAT